MDQRASRRRLIRRILIGLAVFVAVFHLAGGWYFSSQIRADGLEPQAPTHGMGVEVIALGDSIISLDGDDRDGIEQPGVAGLWWSDGYGFLGAIEDTEGSVVTRRFTHVSGAPPHVCSAPGTCDDHDIESYTYQTDPGDAGLAFTEVSYDSPLGPMKAWLVEPGSDATGTWAIHAHGWRAERRETVRMLSTYADLGMTSLVVEYRNDPDAPQDPSGLYRFGRTEWEDLEAAVQYAIDAGAERIVLAGYSTGAAIELAFLERSPLADHVVGLVFDAPNIDFGSTVKTEAADRSIPGTPIPLPTSLTATAMWLADLRYDVGWGDIDYTNRDGIVTVPTLVFHGDADDTVPVSVSEAFAERYPQLVRLVVTEGAGHVQSWNLDPDRYEELLRQHLESLGV